jgi:hypothetical protein
MNKQSVVENVLGQICTDVFPTIFKSAFNTELFKSCLFARCLPTLMWDSRWDFIFTVKVELSFAKYEKNE